jgi:hypothetical protein
LHQSKIFLPFGQSAGILGVGVLGFCTTVWALFVFCLLDFEVLFALLNELEIIEQWNN